METTEKKVSHTPGPWKINGTSVLDKNGFGLADAEETLVLSGWADTGVDHWSRKAGTTYREITREEAEANAKLIAAAPDMLKACIEAESTIEMLMDTLDRINPSASMSLNSIKKAIKKATE